MSKIEQVQSYVTRADNKLSEARIHLQQKSNYAESVSASQECIELSIKAVFLILEESFSKKHEFEEEDFKKLLGKIPEELQDCNFPRLFLLSKFWSYFYTTAKYGLEKLEIGADKIFSDKEASLALKHAEECSFASFNLLQNKLMKKS